MTSNTSSPRKATDNGRRAPTQARAQVTVRSIFQATAQILDREGEAALSTNRIAAVAGVSIGTLYQYFSTKEAVVREMVSRERRHQLDRLRSLLDEAAAQPLDHAQVFERVIGAMVDAFGGGAGATRSRQTLIRLGWQLADQDNLTQALHEASELVAVYLDRSRSRNARLAAVRTDPVALFVVTRAVMGTIRSAALERSALLGAPAFVADLVRLAQAVLLADATPTNPVAAPKSKAPSPKTKQPRRD